MSTVTQWIHKEFQILKDPRESTLIWVLLLLISGIFIGFLLQYLFPPASMWYL
ncbi:MAG: hypothetical protein MUO73_01005 [Thermoplasmata archaeon]|nr:hypothetical protein [Thermoplasmata archaeon]